MWDKLRYFFSGIKNGILNLITWFPIIWHDRHYDSHYIFLVLRHKLKLTEKHIREHDNHLGAHKDADKIKRCIFILNRIIDDNYFENVMKRHDEKWGKCDMTFTPIDDKPGYSELIIKHKNVKTDKDEKEQKKHIQRCIRHEGYLQKQDVEYLFKLMSKHIKYWWD
jgi:hypothetical protein